MLTKLSSKGQLIIPKEIRRSLALEPGTQFQVEVLNKKIVLKPVSAVPSLKRLYGKYRGTDLLRGLEKEHREEVRKNAGLPA